MSQSEYAFPRSRVILQQLARNGQQSPPPQNGSAHEYLDSSLAIRARTSVTKDDFEARHDLQAKGIRLEFENQRKYVDRRFDELVTKEQFEQQRTYITKFQENVNQRFGDVDQRFRDIDQRFRDIDQRFDEVDQRFGDIDQRFDEVDQRFEQVYSTLDEFRTRFTQIQGESHNRQSFKGWHTIYPLGLFDPGGGFRMPANFPSTIREFWKLKLPSHMPRLISLIQFYDIQGYEWWGLEEMETDESDRGGPSRQPLSLEVAVHSYPDMGLEALAQRLGLKYQKIRDFMERVDESKRNPMAAVAKREHVGLVGSERVGKMAKSEVGQPVGAVQGPVQTLERIPIELVMKDRSTTESKESDVSRVMWNDSEAGRAREAMIRRMTGRQSEESAEAITPSMGQGSTVPNTISSKKSSREGNSPAIEKLGSRGSKRSKGRI